MKGKYHHLFWQLYALAYDTLMHVKPYRRYLEHMLSHVAPEEPTLDIGCGTANLWDLCQHRDISLTLLDGSPIMLNQAREKLRYREKTRFTQFNIADIPVRNLPFDDGTFVQITMGNALYPHTEPLFILKECMRVLAPNGRLIVSEPKPGFKLEEIFQGHIGGETTFEGDNSLRSGLKMLLKALMVDRTLVPYAPALAMIVLCNVLALSKSPTFISSTNLRNLMQEAGLSVISVEDSYEGQNTLIVAHKSEETTDDVSANSSP